jgi:hypothetical protein
VAAGAGDRQAEEGAADGIDMLFPFIGDGGLDDVGRQLQLLEIGGAEAEEAQRRQICGPLLGQNRWRAGAAQSGRRAGPR